MWVYGTEYKGESKLPIIQKTGDEKAASVQAF